ncbi:MAG: PDZ domain-containing protein [Akkermansiaceae bacterium]|nr:PDZ domain-containing protein [Akkermansiaceae bacterium]
MHRLLFILALSGLALTGCNPTERTAITKKVDKKQPTTQPEQPLPPAEKPAVTQPEPSAAALPDASASLLTVSLTVQDYNRVMPWEKRAASSVKHIGVYLGEGKVLTLGRDLGIANYVEISLPDSTRTVSARVLRYDRDLNLGLLIVEDKQDATIFEGRTALSLGEPLSRTDKATLHCTLNGTQAVSIDLQGEVGSSELGLPRLQMRADQAVPGNYSHGAPVVVNGKLVGISCGYNAASRQLKVINADLIGRFLSAAPEAPQGVPIAGVTLVELTDPVFRSYLKLNDASTGVYISKVDPAGAAAAAGLQKGDVITSVEGLKIDNRGRCEIPLYGTMDVTTVMRYLKPLGETLKVTYSRDGQEHETVLQLNRDAEEKALIYTENAEDAPRYFIWGGLVFQPLTTNYMNALQQEAKALPIEFMKLSDQEEELQKRGFKELTVLTLVVPTKATLGYDGCDFALVEKVNGKEPHSFQEFVALLQAPTESGMVEISINKPPYRFYMESAAAEQANSELRRAGIINLQRLSEKE